MRPKILAVEIGFMGLHLSAPKVMLLLSPVMLQGNHLGALARKLHDAPTVTTEEGLLCLLKRTGRIRVRRPEAVVRDCVKILRHPRSLSLVQQLLIPQGYTATNRHHTLGL